MEGNTMSTNQKKRIHNINRVIIIILSALGFFADGFQVNDLVFLAATAMWIWLPELNRFDESLFESIDKH